MTLNPSDVVDIHRPESLMGQAGIETAGVTQPGEGERIMVHPEMHGDFWLRDAGKVGAGDYGENRPRKLVRVGGSRG